MKDESLLKKYEAEVARIEGLKVTLQVEEGRLKWLIAAGILGGGTLAAFGKPIFGFLFFALGIVMFGTGLYLTRVHKMERDYNLIRAKEEVARLRAREREQREAKTAEAANSGVAPAVPTAETDPPALV